MVLLNEIFGRFVQHWIGFPALFCGVFIAFGLWCFDYVASEWNVGRRASAILLAIVGACLVVAGLVVADSSPVGLLKTAIVGVLYYWIFRKISRKQLAVTDGAPE